MMSGKIYTRRGDDGETRLRTGEHIAKHSDRVAAYGSLYELNSFIGHARSLLQAETPATPDQPWIQLDLALRELQQRLFLVGSDLSQSLEKRKEPSTMPVHTQTLEHLVDLMRDASPPWHPFTLPEGTPAATALYMATTVCRRAEREILRLNQLEPVPKPVLTFVNRLSDALFAAARYVNHVAGVAEEATRLPSHDY
jgi:cob(I)alamin adenosyltransferase